jgi:hypothetical protein
MSAITIQLPDDLAERFRQNEERLPEILELVLKQLDSTSEVVFKESAAILEFLAGFPSPQEVLDLRTSERFHQRIAELLEVNRSRELSHREQKEWEQYEQVEHLVRIAKAKALLMLAAKNAPNA